MADKAYGNVSASVFLDDMKSSMSGALNYEPKDSNDKWLFAEVAVNNTSSDLVTDRDYLGSADTTVVADDDVAWIAIKNLSTTAGEELLVTIASTVVGNIGPGGAALIPFQGDNDFKVTHASNANQEYEFLYIYEDTTY